MTLNSEVLRFKMANTLKYFVDSGHLDTKSIFDDWDWLLAEQNLTLHKITCMGDAFLLNDKGQVLFLDVLGGKISHFAENQVEFDTKIDDRAIRKKILLSNLIQDLKHHGVVLNSGECYSPDHPPILGGNLDVENIHPTDIYVHMSIMGQIHNQVRHLPPGSPIKILSPGEKNG
jgi:hypothetical protein